MHLPSVLLIPIFAIGALAIFPFKVTTDGVNSSLVVDSLATGNRVATQVSDGCREKNRDGVQINVGEACLWNAILYMIEALRDAQAATGVALLSNTVNNMQPIDYEPRVNISGNSAPSPSVSIISAATTPPLKLKRQDESARQALWAELNDQISRRSEDGHRPRAVRVGHSDLHPTDGLAVRTNVHSGDATLHVHTNGSHATAAFTRNSIAQLARRETSFASGSEFFFEGAQGLKFQIRRLDEKAYDVLSVLLRKISFGTDGLAPRLEESDSWAFALCRNSNNEQTLWGKLVAEDNGAGDDYEEQGLIDCRAE